MANTNTKAPEKVKMVKIRLPKIEGEKGAMTIGWNGKIYKVKRGVTVEVPEVVANIIQFSEDAHECAEAYEDTVVHD